MKFTAKKVEAHENYPGAYVVESGHCGSMAEAEQLAARCNMLDELERLAREADVALTTALRQVDEVQRLVGGEGAGKKADDSPVNVTLNGKRVTVPRELSYDRIVQLAGEPGASVTFKHPESDRMQGSMYGGQSIRVQEGTRINAYRTGGA